MTKTLEIFLGACLWCGIQGLSALADDLDSPTVDLSGVPWSFQPLPEMQQLSTALELLRAESQAVPIDLYVHRKLQAHGLAPAPRAASHRQVRRLSLMLTGLPPDLDIAREFMNDPTDKHYVTLVEHYLNSPQFGERWARHWMDVVRFAETWGYEWNHLVREAWRYRDYLIRAFNQDVPYDQLIREHIAGDLLQNPRVNMTLGINESLIGTAFYRFSETGHDDCVLYPDISLDVMDNQIDTLSKAFQALTVSCSRCHDHKLDDIPQSDYYGLLGVMASSRQVIRTLDLPHQQDELKQQLTVAKEKIRRELAATWMHEAESISAERLDELLSSQEPDAAQQEKMEDPLFVWRKMTNLSEGQSWQEPWKAFQSAMETEHERRVVFNRENYVSFGDFSNQKNHWEFEGLAVEGEACFTDPGDFSILPDGPQVLTELLPAGFFSHGLSQKLNAVMRSPLLPENKKFVSYRAMGEHKSVCRTVIANCTLPFFHTNRFDAPKFAWTTVDLAHIRKSPLVRLRSWLEWATALDDQGYPVLNTPQTEYQKLLDNPRSWFGVTQVFAHDVARPPWQELEPQLQVFESSVASPDALAHRYREILKTTIGRWSDGRARESDVFWINAFIDLKLLGREQSISTKLAPLVSAYRALEEEVQTPRRIVGMSDLQEGIDVPLFAGGDVNAPQDVVHRGFIAAVETRIADQVALNGSGRHRVAELIAHPDNPLTARVMVNRIWHHLFGIGIVRSVDNFGDLGDEPSHPELLDYLARRLVDSGWSVKAVIREIVLSDTFRQSSATTSQGKQIDAENNLVHRYQSRRLEAEVIRDSMLTVSGRIDLTMFGPSVDPYRPEDIDSRKLYAGPLDGKGRRSLYLKVTRMGPSRLLELFNFPDPSMTRGRRDRTNVPSQALGLMNHPLVHQQSEVHAGRLLNEAGPSVDFRRSLETLFLRLFSRVPSEVERREYADFFKELASKHGFVSYEDALQSTEVWQDLIHLLYNLKEFTYVL